MSATTVVWVTSFSAGLLGSMIGYWFGFKAGKKWGEADGIKWARERLEDVNRMTAKGLRQ